MVNLGPLTAEIGSGVWGTLANFNGFRVLAALLHGTLVLGVSETLRRRTGGATYIRLGGHHLGHWPTFWLANVKSRSRWLYAVARPSVVCLSSVTFVHPTQPVEILGNVSAPFGTLVID